MNTTTFGENTIFFKDSVLYKLLRKINQNWQIEDLSTRELTNISHDELLKGFLDEQIKFPHPDNNETSRPSEINHSLSFGDLDVNEQFSLENRKWFIDQHIKTNGLIFGIGNIGDSLNKFWDESEFGSKPHPTTVMGWAAKYLTSDKNILSLMALDKNKGNRTSRIESLVTEKCNEAIDNVYLQRTRPTIKAAYENAIYLIGEANKLWPVTKQLKIPSLKYFTKLINSRSAYDVCLARYGSQAARAKFRNDRHSIEAQYPLHIVEIDSTPVDVTLVASNGVVLGKPWLTAVIEVFSRSVLGFHITFDPPSQITLAKTFLNAILPKTNLADEYSGVKGHWPMYGIPDLVLVDNAREYHGKHFDNLCLELGIGITYTPSKTPWCKGHIESFLKFCNFSLTARATGKNFNSIEARADNNPVKEAKIPFENFRNALVMWIVDYYHERVHSRTGRTPKELWDESTKSINIRIPTDIHRIKFLTMEMAHRKLWVYGIDSNSIRYNSDELGEISKRYGHGKQFQIRWDKYDLGHIYVVVPDGKMIKVPANDAYLRYATGMSIFQHTAHLKLLAQHDRKLTANNLAYAAERVYAELHAKRKKLTKKEQLYLEGRIKSLMSEPDQEINSSPQSTSNVAYDADDGFDVPDFESGTFTH